MHLETKQFEEKVKTENLIVFTSSFKTETEAKSILKIIKEFNKDRDVISTCFIQKNNTHYNGIVWAFAYKSNIEINELINFLTIKCKCTPIDDHKLVVKEEISCPFKDEI